MTPESAPYDEADALFDGSKCTMSVSHESVAFQHKHWQKSGQQRRQFDDFSFPPVHTKMLSGDVAEAVLGQFRVSLDSPPARILHAIPRR
jgi:hypothetical protein